jgi:uncharacterized membrane protein YbhN (UPF0104 family)
MLAGAAYLLWAKRDLFEGSLQLDPILLSLILFLKAVVALNSGFRFHLISKLFKLHLSFSEWFGLSAVTTFLTQILPAKTGVIPRAFYLKQHHGVDYSRYTSLLVYLNIYDIRINLFIGAGTALVFAVGHRPEFSMITLALLAGGGFSAALIRILPHLKRAIPVVRLRRIADKVVLGQKDFQGCGPQLLQINLWLLFSLFFRALTLHVCLHAATDTNIPFALTLLASSMANLSMFVSITPANIGITEGIIGYVLFLGGYGPSEILPGLIVSRLGSLLIQLGLGFVFMKTFFQSFDAIRQIIAESQAKKP